MAPASKIAVLILKLAVSITLIVVLVSRIGGQTILDNIRMSSPVAFLGAMACYLLASFLSSRRWRLLVPYGSGIRNIFRMYMIGVFFNTYLPGIVGGDGVKAYYLSRQLKACKAVPDDEWCAQSDDESLKELSYHENIVSIASVFMDRYIGMSALLMISILALPFIFPHLANHDLKWPVLTAIPLVFLTYVVSSLLIFRFRLGEKLKFLYQFYLYFHFYRNRKDVLVKAFLYSLAIQILSISAVYILSEGLSLNLPFLTLVVFVPLIIMISFIPISISGLGIREGAFVVLLGILDVTPDRSLTLSLLWFLSVVAVSLWGLYEYLRFKTSADAPVNTNA